MVKTKWLASEAGFAMSDGSTQSEIGNDGVEKCGNHSSSTKTSCKRVTGWGTERSYGPCRSHTPEQTTDDVMDELVFDEEFYNEHGGFLATLLGIEDSWENHSIEDTVAKKALRQYDSGAVEYRKMFGECTVEGCSSGANGFGADTCYDHRDEVSDESEEDTETDVSVDDLSTEQKNKLLTELLED